MGGHLRILNKMVWMGVFTACLISVGIILGRFLPITNYKEVFLQESSLRVGQSDNMAINAEEDIKNDVVSILIRLNQNPVVKTDKYDHNRSKLVIDEQGVWAEVETDQPITRGNLIRLVGAVKFRKMSEIEKKIILINPKLTIIDTRTSFRDKMRISWGRKIKWFQEKFSLILESYLPEPHGSLLVGILLGLKRSMPEQFRQALIDTGTMHVIAASGYNITIVARVLIAVLNRFMRRRWALVGAIVGIGGYSVLAGAGPAVVRAAIMGTLVFSAQLSGREYAAHWSLIIAGLVMLGVNPELISDVGFWLSVTATGGILWLYEPIVAVSRLMVGRNELAGVESDSKTEDNSAKVSWLGKVIVSEELVTTLAAYLGTLPITIGVFGRISWVAPVVNPLVLWLVPVIMLLGVLKLVFGFVWDPLGYVLGLLAWIPLNMFILVVEVVGNIRGISSEVNFLRISEGGWMVVSATIGYYVILFYWIRKTENAAQLRKKQSKNKVKI